MIAGLGFKGVKGKADPKKRLDLEIKLVNRIIGQNAYFVPLGDNPALDISYSL